jgi:hypothetical protein
VRGPAAAAERLGGAPAQTRGGTIEAKLAGQRAAHRRGAAKLSGANGRRRRPSGSNLTFGALIGQLLDDRTRPEADAQRRNRQRRDPGDIARITIDHLQRMALNPHSAGLPRRSHIVNIAIAGLASIE